MADPSPDRTHSRTPDRTPERSPTAESIRRVCELLKILSSPHRIEILLILADGPRTVSDLVDEFPGVTDQLVSRHLGILRRNGLVEDRVARMFRVYALTGAGTRLLGTLRGLDAS